MSTGAVVPRGDDPPYPPRRVRSRGDRIGRAVGTRGDGGPFPPALPHVVVLGGGIAGLAAAFYLKDEPVRVTVLEGAGRLGGKLSASDVAGVAMDEGAEALLARRPEGIELITAAGLGGDLVPAGVTSSAIYTRGVMRPLPRRQFMGVPADLDELAATGVISPEESRAPGPRR